IHGIPGIAVRRIAVITTIIAIILGTGFAYWYGEEARREKACCEDVFHCEPPIAILLHSCCGNQCAERPISYPFLETLGLALYCRTDENRICFNFRIFLFVN